MTEALSSCDMVSSIMQTKMHRRYGATPVIQEMWCVYIFEWLTYMALADERNVIPSVSANFTRCSQLRNSLLQFVSTGNYNSTSHKIQTQKTGENKLACLLGPVDTVKDPCVNI
jgi:hypothetical protein